MVKTKNRSIIYGVFAGISLLIFYLIIISLLQNFDFAIYSLRNSWFWIFPLSAGFGTQIGLYTSIRHTSISNAQIAGSGGVSAGSMIACCSHFILTFIPLAGMSALATFLVAYQKWFIGLGIISNLIGIVILTRHKKLMKNKSELERA